MNRRDFVSRVTLGGVAACTSLATPALATPGSGPVNIRFVGMMGFIERRDRSFLVATPGQAHSHHMTHVPFLMARRDTAIARAFDFEPVSGVVPEAFDTALIGTRPEDFVYRSLQNATLDVVTGQNDEVMNDASQIADMRRIAPGKRVRGNIEKWATATVSLRGGRLENSSGHPDAGKLWTIGPHRQRLTDAINFKGESGAETTLRLTGATDATTYRVEHGETLDLWVFSAATMDARGGNPKKLTHGELLFDFLVDAQPFPAECLEATGRPIPDTEVPFASPTSAGMGIIASATRFPPDTEFCWPAAFLLGLLGLGGDKK
jgi:hypothetical protein